MPSAYSYISTEDLHLSEHDRRILESMAFKKETERENDEFAHQAHQLWDQDREEREQVHIHLRINIYGDCSNGSHLRMELAAIFWSRLDRLCT
jgi:hypothetical protein